MNLTDISTMGWWGLTIAVVCCFVFETLVLSLLKTFGVYAIVNENEARVYVLFGNVLGVIEEPGLHFLWSELGLGAIVVNILLVAIRWSEVQRRYGCFRHVVFLPAILVGAAQVH